MKTIQWPTHDFFIKKTGIKSEKKIKDFTPVEFKKLCHAITQMEGYREGKITKIQQIIHVKRNKSCIDEYYIIGLGWLSKKACISLARKGLVDAVVCSSRLGNLYLRSRPDHTLKNNFSNMVVN